MDRVVEHRVTLGDYERAVLVEQLAQINEDQDIDVVMQIVNALALPVSIGTLGYLAYLGLVNLGSTLDPLKDSRAAQAAKDAATITSTAADIAARNPDITPEEALKLAQAAHPGSAFGRQFAGLGATLGWLFG